MSPFVTRYVENRCRTCRKKIADEGDYGRAPSYCYDHCTHANVIGVPPGDNYCVGCGAYPTNVPTRSSVSGEGTDG